MRSPHSRTARLLGGVALLVLAVGLVLGTTAVDASAASHRAHHAGHAKHAKAHHQAKKPAKAKKAQPSRAAQVLKLVNAARAHARTCGSTSYAAVPALKANPLLLKAARGFAEELGTENFFDHTAPDGTDPGDRITAAGYKWRSYGENIAAGYDTPKQVVAGWLASEGHCANIMTAFKEVGIGYANVKSSTYGTYWVMDFGTR